MLRSELSPCPTHQFQRDGGRRAVVSQGNLCFSPRKTLGRGSGWRGPPNTAYSWTFNPGASETGPWRPFAGGIPRRPELSPGRLHVLCESPLKNGQRWDLQRKLPREATTLNATRLLGVNGHALLLRLRYSCFFVCLLVATILVDGRNGFGESRYLARGCVNDGKEVTKKGKGLLGGHVPLSTAGSSR